MIVRFPWTISAIMGCLWPILAIAQVDLPSTLKVEKGTPQTICESGIPSSWRDAQIIDGVDIQESRICNPDDPAIIAAVVKGTNNVSMKTFMEVGLAADSIIKKDDIDGDGDPDRIIIKLEVIELNGYSPDFKGPDTTFDIAPGIQPGMWVFAPKTRGMSTLDIESNQANPLLRAPSPVIRVEQGDSVSIVLENGHYFPHTIHLHGVDHPFVDSSGEGNDGVPQTSEGLVMPGESRTYNIKPRQTGAMVYHCHVQTHVHLAMGLVGMFIIEENRPDNWVQTLNIGAGQVRHPAAAIREDFNQEYDLHYHALDKELHSIIQSANDPRLIAKKMNREYDLTDSSEDYHTLNGRSFPYTLFESLITVDPDEKVKIRLFNSQGETLAMHTHGHKATITHYDGIEHNPAAQITRDVYDLAPAQRMDLTLDTTNDGLHNYGEGIWIFHDHREKGITTDGMNPGGNISAVVYKKYLTEEGMPKVQGIDLAAYFTKEFQQRSYPVWQDADEWNSLGEVDTTEKGNRETADGSVVSEEAHNVNTPQTDRNSFRNLFVGLLAGLLLYFIIVRREQVMKLINSRMNGKGVDE
ncbi:MAG: multicopper oxidase domain-containing protein [Methylococcales bacterium]